MTLNTVHVMANIANQYNAQNFDNITGATVVSDADIQLLKVIQDLYAVINDLNDKVLELTVRVHDLETSDAVDQETMRDIYRECF